jgi:hypothetical protein
LDAARHPAPTLSDRERSQYNPAREAFAMKHKHTGRRSRRELLGMGAVLGGSLLAGRHVLAAETEARKLGVPLGPYSERSPFEKAVRWRRESRTPETGSSFTPLQDSVGTVTPSALHYERHHSGVPSIDPSRHRLVIHGMVDRPLSLSMADIRRLPSVTRTLWNQRIGRAIDYVDPQKCSVVCPRFEPVEGHRAPAHHSAASPTSTELETRTRL